MSVWGLDAGDYAEDESADGELFMVWPDNWPAVLFFASLGGGAWNMGPGGPAGIRPEAFAPIREAQRIDPADWPELFEAVRVMESAALEVIHAAD